MASYSVKACANTKTRGRAMLVISVFAILTVFCVAMAIYDIVTGRRAFGIMFAAAALVFVVLLLLRVNSVFGTYIKVKDDALFMKSWVNDFLPYDINGGFLAEMIPSKTKLTEIPVEEISLILVGSKEFIKRNATVAGKRLAKALYPYEHSARKAKKELISKMDLFYVETFEGECSFMCIYGYDPKKVVDVIGEVYSMNPDTAVRVNSREYKRYIKALQRQFDDYDE